MRWRVSRLFAAGDRIDDRFLGGDPLVERDESVLWSVVANRAQGARAVGGRLVLTEQRVIFAPSRLERRLRGQRWSCPVGIVEEVGIQERGGSVLSGGARRRLRLVTSTGHELFVVNDVEAAASAVRSLLAL